MSTTDISEVGVTLIDSNKPELGIVLKYEGTTLCNDTAYYSLILQLNCEVDRLTPSYKLDTSSLNTPCSPKVIMNTKEACPIIALNALYFFF